MFNLNAPQSEVVSIITGPLLIIADAESGKTGVITHRIAYMLESGISRSTILSLTGKN
jgi:DNA helicase-2/ATP-dependent DNA helicase PcrA